ncbi:hypothetical protein NTE11_003072 [Vibrio fluvialis]|nr:hypothetical protein [Vibrio fluvialis]EKO3461169.1 hypothetical protein [Vibrio fluvialis]
MTIKGIDAVKAGYQRIIGTIEDERTEAAIYAILSEGGAIAQTMVPVDTSTLINSQYAPQFERQAGGMTGYIGYTAKYAGWVHEMPGKLKGLPRAHFGVTREGVQFGGGTLHGNYWDPDAEPQWLTKGFQQLQPKIPAILKRVYRV